MIKFVVGNYRTKFQCFCKNFKFSVTENEVIGKPDLSQNLEVDVYEIIICQKNRLKNFLNPYQANVFLPDVFFLFSADIVREHWSEIG